MNNVLRWLLLLCAFPSFSQHQGCGQDIAYKRLFEQDPAAKARFIQFNTSSGFATSSKEQTASSFTIPVVFHVLHLGGAENISDAQIHDAINILNHDFRKQNADTSAIVTEYKNIAADCNIQFSLATIDDNGRCTNGITRHYDTRTNWTINMSDYVYTWPSSKYLNIYVVKSLPPGVAGYCYLPGTVAPPADAVVILSQFIGSVGTGNPYTSRALTHEVGHWLSLSHTWGNTNNPGVACGDDGVSDTPLTKGHGSCDLNNAIDCTPGVVENIQNYMEYAYCSNMYTQGQRTKIHACLNGGAMNRSNVSSNSNLIATGIVNPQNNCPPRAEFIYVNNISCVGYPLSFIDQSYNGQPSGWLWSSPSASNVSGQQNGALTFINSGITSVQLKASNIFGSDSISKSPFIILSAASYPGSLNMQQGFESGIFPDNNWIFTTPQYGSGFQLTNSVSATGAKSVWVNNYFDNPNGSVSFFTPAYNFHAMQTGHLSFSYAYAQQSLQNNDRLRIYVSSDCGGTWTVLYSASGSSLSTTPGLVGSPFVPAASEWKTENIDILSLSGKPRVYFRFEFLPDPNGPGNNIYVDDINLNTVMGLEETALGNDLRVYPNPFSGLLTIEALSLQKINSAEIYDISGRKVFENKMGAVGVVVLSGAEALQEGIYFLKVKTDSGEKTVKLLKN